MTKGNSGHNNDICMVPDERPSMKTSSGSESMLSLWKPVVSGTIHTHILGMELLRAHAGI